MKYFLEWKKLVMFLADWIRLMFFTIYTDSLNANPQLYRNRAGFHKSCRNLYYVFFNQDKSLWRFLHVSIEQISKKLTTIFATGAMNPAEVSYKKTKINPLKARQP